MTYSVLMSLFNVRSITYNGIKGIKCLVFDPQLQYAKIVFVHVGGTQCRTRLDVEYFVLYPYGLYP